MVDKTNVLLDNRRVDISGYRARFAEGYFEGKGSPSFSAGAAYTAALGAPPVDIYKMMKGEENRLRKELEESGLPEKVLAAKRNIAKLEREREIISDVLSFIDTPKPKVMERPVGSDLHKLIDADRRGDVVYEDEKVQGHWKIHWADILVKSHVFLIEHDWDAAFKNADFSDGDFVLPYEYCVFEFQVSGRRVILLMGNPSGKVDQVLFIAGKGGFLAAKTYQKWMENLIRQARAACISLDAGVVVTEVMRADSAKNIVRERRNAPPISDYHVLMLRRQRASALPASGAEPAYRVRLHWRRGHWRHFPTHKTWIKWMLVGSPDLGFVDKHYRLA